MNYKWKQMAERGQYEIGFIDIYELVYKQKAIAIIHYLPQHSQTKQRVVFTLILEGIKKDWTDGIISNIFEDVENRVKNVECFKFNNYNSIEYMDTQIFTIDKIENFDYFNHGDVSFINEDKK